MSWDKYLLQYRTPMRVLRWFVENFRIWSFVAGLAIGVLLEYFMWGG